MATSDATLAYARVTEQIPRKESDPTIEQDAVTLAAEIRRLNEVLLDVRIRDKEIMNDVEHALAKLRGQPS